jgi:cathepsin D
MLLSLPLSLILLLPALSYAEPLHFTLTRRASSVTPNADYINSLAEHLRYKYGIKVNKKRASSAGISMINQVSLSQVINIGGFSQCFF